MLKQCKNNLKTVHKVEISLIQCFNIVQVVFLHCFFLKQFRNNKRTLFIKCFCSNEVFYKQCLKIQQKVHR